jgi:hypothetical protein
MKRHDFEIDDLWAEVFITWVKLGSPTKPRNRMKIQYFWRMTPWRWVTWHCVIRQNTWNITTAAEKYENCCPLNPFVQIKGPTQLTNYKLCNFTIYSSLTISRKKEFLINKSCEKQFKLFCAVSVIMHTWQTFLGAFVKLRKATISFSVSVCLSVHMQQLISRCTDFRGI